MKKIVAALLLAAMLVAPSVGAAADDVAALELDSASPLTAMDNVVLVEKDTTAAQARSAFKNNRDIVLTSPGGEALASADTVGSGVVVSRPGGDDKMTLIVPGDVNGDAKINARDVVAALRLSLDSKTDGVYPVAADVDGDGKITANDIISVMKHIVGWNVTLGASERPVADKDDSRITMYFDSLMHRISQDDTTVYGSADGLFYTAKNELEDAQIVLTSEVQMKDLTLEVSAPTNENGKTLGYEVRYGYYYDLILYKNPRETALNQDYNNYPVEKYVDPYPLLNGTFDIGKDQSKSFMVQVDVPADAESGYYKSDVVLKDSAGNEIKRATLRFYVWDIVLDEETACDTMFLTWEYGTAGYYVSVYDRKYSDGATWKPLFVRNFYDYMLKNRISGYELPYDILDSRADAYMSNPRVTSFVTCGGMASFDWTDADNRTKLRAVYDKLETNPEWAEKAYIYTVDEPWGPSGAEIVKNQWMQANSVLGDTPFKTILPFGNMYMKEQDQDMFEVLYDYCNAFCPGAGVFTEYAPFADRKKDPIKYPLWGEYMEPGQFAKYGNFQSRYETLRDRGDSMWWYVCIGPWIPYANFFNYYQCAWNRTVLWQQYIVNSDGLLYWNTSNWELDGGRKINLRRTNNCGDGILVYDAMLWGASEPSLTTTGRFEAIRDGIEDFQYMRQLERVAGREAVLPFVQRVTTDVTHYEEDYRVMVRARTEMGFMLEALGE